MKRAIAFALASASTSYGRARAGARFSRPGLRQRVGRQREPPVEVTFDAGVIWPRKERREPGRHPSRDSTLTEIRVRYDTSHGPTPVRQVAFTISPPSRPTGFEASLGRQECPV